LYLSDIPIWDIKQAKMGKASDVRRAKEAAAKRVRKRLGAPGLKRAAKAKITKVKSGGGGGRRKTVTEPVVTTAAPAAKAAPQVTAAAREKALEPFTKTPFQQIQERQITYAAAIGREETPAIYPQGVTRKPRTKFEQVEAKVARRVTKPVARAAARVGVTPETVGRAAAKVAIRQRPVAKQPESILPTKAQVAQQEERLRLRYTEAGRGLVEQPVKTTAVAVGAAGLSYGLGAAQLGAARLAPAAYLKTLPLQRAAGKVVSRVAVGAYGFQKYREVQAAPTIAEQERVVGRALTTEVGPFVAGSAFARTPTTRLTERAQQEAFIKAKLGKQEQKLFTETQKLAQEVKRQKIRPEDPRIDEVLPPNQAAATKKYLAKRGKKAIVYGSTTQPGTFRPQDIDVAVKDPYTEAVRYSEAIYKATGVRPKIRTEALAKGKKVKVPEVTVEFAQGGRVAEIGSALDDVGAQFAQPATVTFHQTTPTLKQYAFYQGKPVKTPSGIYVIQPQEQLLRKFSGGFTAGRAKDVPQFYEYKGILEAKVRQAKGIKIKPTQPVSKFPTAPPPGTAVTKPTYRVPKTPSYVPPVTPRYKAPVTPQYKAPYKRPYTPPYRAPYKAAYKAPYTPPYTPPYTAPYTPPYTPPYTAPYTAPYKLPYTPPYTPPRTPTVRPATVPGFTLERRPEPFTLRLPGKPRRLAQPKRYAPTLRATLGRIKAPKGKAKKFRLTGLEERPILF
tara:strand:- start:391 stop:2577 length:2187 start_codon:yes stop_codon:yes gene_type:complete